jgi:peptidoglycan/LPS O-acetylase OafA/YrhL
MIGQPAKVYFPSLNGLRFIAALMVIIHHLEQLKSYFGLPNAFTEWHFIKIMGDLGADLFFTLSGFLITYLLLSEYDKYKTIDVKRFYIRRCLKIAPLYYLIIILGLFILPHLDFFKIPQFTEGGQHQFGIKAFFYFFMLPNVVSSFYAHMPFLSQTWSVGVEQLFYLISPFVLKFSKKHLKILGGIILGMVLITNILHYFASPENGIIEQGSSAFYFFSAVYPFFEKLRISCMAIGAIGAYYLYYLNAPVLRFLFTPYTQLISGVVVLQLMLFGIEIPILHHEVYSLFFIVIILNLAANPDCYFSLENKMMNYLGKISYSMYMWHSIALVVGLKSAIAFNIKIDDFYSNTVYYFVALVVTLALSIASYELFEKPFLNYKNQFAKIPNGDVTENANIASRKNLESNKKFRLADFITGFINSKMKRA